MQSLNNFKIINIELIEYWNGKTTEKKKIMDWIELFGMSSKSVQGAKHLDIKDGEKFDEVLFTSSYTTELFVNSFRLR